MDATPTWNTDAAFLRRGLQILGFMESDARLVLDEGGAAAINLAFPTMNSQGVFAVLYFLFACVDPMRHRQELEPWYPVVNKAQRDAFSEGCMRWLGDLEKKHVVPMGSSSKLILKSCSGPKLVTVLRHLTMYVMRLKLLSQEDEITSTPSLVSKLDEEWLSNIMNSWTQHQQTPMQTQLIHVEGDTADSEEQLWLQELYSDLESQIEHTALSDFALSSVAQGSYHMKMFINEAAQVLSEQDLINEVSANQEIFLHKLSSEKVELDHHWVAESTYNRDTLPDAEAITSLHKLLLQIDELHSLIKRGHGNFLESLSHDMSGVLDGNAIVPPGSSVLQVSNKDSRIPDIVIIIQTYTQCINRLIEAVKSLPSDKIGEVTTFLDKQLLYYTEELKQMTSLCAAIRLETDDLIRSSANEATALPSAMKCRLPNSPSTPMKEGSPARNATFLIDTPDFDRNSREDILIRLQSSIHRVASRTGRSLHRTAWLLDTTYEKPVNRKIEFNEPEYSPPKSQVQPKQQVQQALVPTNTQKIPVTKPTAITAPQPTIHQQSQQRQPQRQATTQLPPQRARTVVQHQPRLPPSQSQQRRTTHTPHTQTHHTHTTTTTTKPIHKDT
ncbi:hypothetical protein Pelo_14246 [Pelomyxa schiedti]|nr:hypothetical protein Pelo_14246 [Pelomyxa schiedti]